MLGVVVRVKVGDYYLSLAGGCVDKLAVTNVHSDMADGVDIIREEHEVARLEV